MIKCDTLSIEEVKQIEAVRKDAYKKSIRAIYGPMIYTAPYIMLFMWANPLRGQVGGGLALEIKSFLGAVKWHRAVRE
jgi:hypothetical protein